MGRDLNVNSMEVAAPLRRVAQNTRRYVMRRLAVFAMVCLLVAAGVVYAKDYEVTKKVGEYTIEISIDRNPPVVGNNNMQIAVKDAAGKALTDAKVMVEYSMAPMPGMPAANYKTEAALKADKYRATMNLSMAGPWSIAIKMTRADKTQTAKFTVDAK
jgi:hypothetical protein